MLSDLKEYQRKRKFKETTEPKGKVKKIGLNRFVIQKHKARNLHYDFRLELNGVLKSWAVPKGLPDKKGTKRLAIQTEDHPVDYINFKGKIPEGLYGAGIVEIFDKGKYKLKKRSRNVIEFNLAGKRYKGSYVLFKLKSSKYKTNKSQWLIMKK